jgi:hypothetical protein
MMKPGGNQAMALAKEENIDGGGAAVDRIATATAGIAFGIPERCPFGAAPNQPHGH